ncbi:hypothetical protein IW261DRAFT_1498182 [Armillaria novae-zelandiae]|uniref:Uncharacterized protein n=1 Tax=Armillaria novae-zelandiae TaxID=153914 RepID=A0AA39NZT2_9AGAR|nr:hypothetical protein IW261DRAFT_1498182 [Armillaria novae-zelandiae]
MWSRISVPLEEFWQKLACFLRTQGLMAGKKLPPSLAILAGAISTSAAVLQSGLTLASPSGSLWARVTMFILLLARPWSKSMFTCFILYFCFFRSTLSSTHSSTSTAVYPATRRYPIVAQCPALSRSAINPCFYSKCIYFKWPSPEGLNRCLDANLYHAKTVRYCAF